MLASMMVGLGESKEMGTKKKACLDIIRKELAYLLSRLHNVDATIM